MCGSINVYDFFNTIFLQANLSNVNILEQIQQTLIQKRHIDAEIIRRFLCALMSVFGKLFFKKTWKSDCK